MDNILAFEKDVGNIIKTNKNLEWFVCVLADKKVDLYDKNKFEENNQWYVNNINRLLKIIPKYIKS